MPPSRPGSSASATRPSARLRSAATPVAAQRAPADSPVLMVEQTPFAETPAIVRTAEGTGRFAELERQSVAEAWRAPGMPESEEGKALEEKLREMVRGEDALDDWATADNGIGEKRKMCVFLSCQYVREG